MNIKDKIIADFQKHKISQMQLDPNGLCNASCWFCPVSTKGNPKHAMKPMPIDLLKRILDNILEEREKENGLVAKTFNGFYTSHYNETLLYPHLEEFLDTLKQNGLMTMILTNGTPLTPKKADLLKKYDSVISGLNFNVPILTNAKVWSKRTGMKEGLYKNLIRNIKYVYDLFPERIANGSISIGMNGINTYSLFENGGWIEPGKDFPDDIDLRPEQGENKLEVNVGRAMFPGMNIYGMTHLIDRAGLLEDKIDNKKAINKFLQQNENKQVTSCGNGVEVGGRPIGWIHINAIGQAFLCCNDYDMEIVVGDLSKEKLSDFWGKANHIDKIVNSYNTICRNCASAKFN